MAGGMCPFDLKPPLGRCSLFSEREEISPLKLQGKASAIARLVGRNPGATIRANQSLRWSADEIEGVAHGSAPSLTDSVTCLTVGL